MEFLKFLIIKIDLEFSVINANILLKVIKKLKYIVIFHWNFYIENVFIKKINITILN